MTVGLCSTKEHTTKVREEAETAARTVTWHIPGDEQAWIKILSVLV